MDGIIRTISEWRAKDETRRELLDEIIAEMRTDIKEIKAGLHKSALQKEKLSTWAAHDRLKEKVEKGFKEIYTTMMEREANTIKNMNEMEKEIKKELAKWLGIGLSACMVVLGIIQLVISNLR